MAGASERAGLKEPPVKGPTTTAAVKTKPPMAIGAKTPYQGARASVATALMSITKRAVAITSSAKV